jgi:D-alanyl-D-alanine carboxypeptidase
MNPFRCRTEEETMLRRALTGILAATLLLVPATAGIAAAHPPPADPTQALLQRLLTAEHDAGMPGVFAQVRDGRRTVKVAAGLADVDTGLPADADMRHRVGSITKTFVATTVLQLVAERRVRLDAPIGRYLPDVVPGDTGRLVTVRMLLNHTSGIGDYILTLAGTLDGVIAMGDTTYAPRELARIGLARPTTNPPGAKWTYSNTNYVLLALMVEKVTGHSYRSEIGRRILRPLGLRDTYFEGAEPQIRGPHMSSYVPWVDGKLRDFSAYNMTWAWGVGEIVSTAADLNRFYRALLTGRLLRPAQLAAMQTTVVEDPAHPDVGGYGLGLYWLQAPCGRFWGHDGGTIGHATISLTSPDGRRQVTMAENMRYYAAPGVITPIDVARGQFLVTALCGPQQTATQLTAAARAARPTMMPWTPDVSLPAR